ncbi:Acyl-CoA N-acyltransferase [Penicillium camemberti]|uniref:Acyl-CoA N-acyltransferase n=1 Tax=Penicillium camemberti (strain FM 013) TaxID=1429867 RepID=A0A0G4PHX2_PENC3|nr:Acyl-CoA N-acyltransferase [Penicillium camemberti]
MCTDSESDVDDQDRTPKAFRSENLEFRSYNSEEDDEFFHSIQIPSSSIINWCASTPRPMDLNFTSRVAKHLQRRSHLFVIIYVDDEYYCFVPVGTLFLKSSHRDMVHHRCSKLEVSIIKEHQHYEAEAINWALNWAFNSANLHRVEVAIPSWNLRMGKLCDEVGFHTEGERKECYFKDGEWWNEVNMSMLKKDWKER